MKRILSTMLCVLLLSTAVPFAASAEEVNTQTCNIDVPCLERDLPHGDALWEQIYALERQLPDLNGAESYYQIMAEVEQLVRASGEVAQDSIEVSEGCVCWNTLDGMAHRYSPELRAEISGYFSGDDSDESPAVNDESQKHIEDAVSAQEDSSVGLGSTTAKNIAVLSPYYGYTGDGWQDMTALISSLAKITGGTYKDYRNDDATIDALADMLESCAVVFINTHGSTDKRGKLNDTSMSNTSYFTLTTGAGITSADCVWTTGQCGRYQHAFKGGSPPEAAGHDVYYVDGTAVTNHMELNAPNNLVWMECCLSMATDGICAPLRSRGVGVVYGYSKPVSFLGADQYTELFFDSLKEGNTVSQAAKYMKEMSGSSWDPYYNVSYNGAVASGIAFPVFADDIDPYPGQRNVDSVQSVYSSWRLPFKNESDCKTEAVLYKDMVQRVDCKLRFTPNLTAASVSSGALPPGMSLYRTEHELYVRGTPTQTGTFTANIKITDSVYGQLTHTFRIHVCSQTVKTETKNITFTTGSKQSTNILTSCIYSKFAGGSLPRNGRVELSSNTLKFVTDIANTPPGSYTAKYDVVDSSYTRRVLTLSITVDPKSNLTLSNRSVTMALNRKGVVEILNTQANGAFYNVEITSGSIPDGTLLVSRFNHNFNIIGTPTQSGTFNCALRLSRKTNSYTMNLTVNVLDASRVNSNISCHSVTGGTLSTETVRCDSSYTLPQYNGSIPSDMKFTGWMYNGKVYQAGTEVDIDAMQMAFYACCEYKTLTAIETADCTVNMPVAGTHPDMYPISCDSEKYSVKISNWTLNESPYSSIGASDTFAAGKQYSVRVSFEAKPGYKLDDSTVYKINGSAPAHTSGTTAVAVYTAASPAVAKIDSTLTVPVGGKSPDYRPIPVYAGYTASVKLWYLNKSPEYTHLSPDDTFEGGKSYRVRVKYSPIDGCNISSDAEYFINGKKATYVGANTYEVVFTALKSVSSVTVYGSPKAEAGETSLNNPPGYSVSASSGCAVSSQDWAKLTMISTSPMRLGYVKFSGAFADGTTYYPRVYLKVLSGYTFADEVKVKFSDSGAVSTGIIQSDGTLRATGDGVTAKSDVMIGDINGDGKIDINDATMVQKAAAEIATLTASQSIAADVNRDGNIDVTDVTLIQKYAAEIIDHF